MALFKKSALALGLLVSISAQANNLSLPEGTQFIQSNTNHSGAVIIKEDLPDKSVSNPSLEDIRKNIQALTKENAKLTQTLNKTLALIDGKLNPASSDENKPKQGMRKHPVDSTPSTRALQQMITEMMELSVHMSGNPNRPYKLYVLTQVAHHSTYGWSYMGEFDNRQDCMTAGNVLSKQDSSRYSGYDRDPAQLEGTPYGCI